MASSDENVVSSIVEVSVCDGTHIVSYFGKELQEGHYSSVVHVDLKASLSYNEVNDVVNDEVNDVVNNISESCGIVIPESCGNASFAVPDLAEVKKISGRKCCALNCCESGRTLHTFPSIIVKGKINIQNLERCRDWVQKSGNEQLLNMPSSKLNGKRFLCSSHFETSQYYRSDRKRLLPHAVPSLFKERILTDHVMERFPVVDDCERLVYHLVEPVVMRCNKEVNIATEDIGITHNSVDDLVLLNGCSRTSTDYNSLSQDLIGENRSELLQEGSASNIDDNNNLSLGPELLEEIDILNEASTSNNNINQSRKRKIFCCYNGCFNSNKDHSIFHFPYVICTVYGQKRVNDANLRRFIKWVEASGNAQLTLLDPISVYKKFYVCSAHFEDNCFINSKRLKTGAVPSLNVQFFSSPIIMDQYKRTLNIWKENIDGGIEFTSDASIAFAFDESMKAMHWVSCPNCFEKHLSNQKDSPPCQHYSHCWEYTAENNMDPLDVPEELQNLTYIEEQLIARVHPVISVFKLKGLQYGYRGNIINFSQDVNEIVSKLPLRVEDLNSVMTVTYKNLSGKCHDFHVRSGRVKTALTWLKQNNEFYHDVEISEENLATLPEDGDVLHEIPTVQIDRRCEDTSDKNGEEGVANNDNENECVQRSVVPDIQVPHQDKQIENKIQWPSMTSKVDEFHSRGYMVLAFPTLYPYGKADYLDVRRVAVSSNSYFRHMLSYHDRRFVKHPTYRFFAFNSWLRWTGLNDGNIFVRNNQEFKNITIPKLKDMLKENPNLIKKIMFQASNLKGTNAYWHCKAGELKDLVQQIGLPTIFLTLSCADGHWEDLYKLLADKEDVSDLTERERRTLLQENPDIVDTFFDMRVQSFIANVLQKKYKIKDYWYRVEYQHRGSPHIHGVFWFEGAPDVSKLANASEEELSNVIDYFSNIVTAVNPKIDVAQPDTHPCRVSFQNVECVQEDLAQLLLKVQRHSKCSTEYCIRVNKKTKIKQCRFKFPHDMQEKATIEKGENGELEFKPMRNDPLLNKFNAFIIQLWRANIDIAPVISEKALLAYLAKYISKSEVKSQALTEVVDSIFAELDDDLPAKKFIQKLYMKSCAERDVSAQEVCHIMLGHKLCSAGGRQFVIVNTTDKKWKRVDENDYEGDFQGKGKSFVEKYRERPDNVENVSLWNAAKYYNLPKWTKITSGKEHIVRVFPRLSKCDGTESNEAYYRQQVLLHLPWRYEENIKIDGEEWKDVYERCNIHEKAVTIYKIGNNENEEEFELPDDSSSDSEDEEEFMLLSRLGPANVNMCNIDLGRREVDLQYDWTQSWQKYTQYGTLQDFQNFIDNLKQNENEVMYNAVMPEVQFSPDQQKIMDIINDQIRIVMTSETEVNERCVKRIIIQGKAGTGKSFLIKYITAVLENKLGFDSYLLGAPTGVSAILINGKTLHSLLKLPPKKSQFKELQGESVRDLANKFMNVKYLILDEWSMVGCTILSMIDERCKQATGNYNEDFGGLFVILLGDGKQLPPIKDASLYSKIQKTDRAKRGKALINNFQRRFVLVTSHRQQGDHKFLKTLDNIGNANVSLEDYQLLSTRFDYKLSCEEKKTFEEAIRLFSTRNDVKEYNRNSLVELKDESTGAPLPVLKIIAKHNCSAAKKASADQFEGLEKNIYVAKNCKIMLRQNIWLEKGLINGAMGRIYDVIYDPANADMPAILLCEFENYTGPSLIPNLKIVPIKPMLKSITDGCQNCTRLQFPVSLAYAVSIHKSQGMTLDKAVINIGRNEFAFGLAYVAFSRVRKLSDMVICPFLYARLQRLSLTPVLHERNDFMKQFI